MNGRPGDARTDAGSTDVDELELAAIPSAVSLTRRFTEAFLRKRDLEEVTDTARLIASELVTNAIRATGVTATPAGYAGLHGARLARIIARLHLAPPGLFIEVWDEDPRPPVRVQPGALDEGGRGLLLVTALAAAWGHYPCDRGKVVWAQIASPGHLTRDAPPTVPGGAGRFRAPG